MTDFFGRQIRVEAGSLVISDLRVKFNIVKSLVGYPNLANIQIYNLKEASRNQLIEEGSEVSLFAGYDNIVLLFKGSIINAIPKKEGVDWVSTIYAGDSMSEINSATINKTLAAGSTPSQIFNELVNSIPGVTKGITDGIANCLSEKQSLLRALQLSGDVKKWLQQLADD